jgi:hypothetical protein
MNESLKPSIEDIGEQGNSLDELLDRFCTIFQ